MTIFFNVFVYLNFSYMQLSNHTMFKKRSYSFFFDKIWNPLYEILSDRHFSKRKQMNLLTKNGMLKLKNICTERNNLPVQ